MIVYFAFRPLNKKISLKVCKMCFSVKVKKKRMNVINMGCSLCVCVGGGRGGVGGWYGCILSYLNVCFGERERKALWWIPQY